MTSGLRGSWMAGVALASAGLLALAPSTSQLRLPLLLLVGLLLLLLVPLLAVLLAVFAPLAQDVAEVSAGPVTLPRLLAVLLAVRVLAAAPRQSLQAARLLAPALALFGWLALRGLGSAEGREQALDLARLGLLAVVVVVLGARLGAVRLRTGLALAALAFVLLNTLLGQETETGGRWQGLTGNPNLLAAVVAVMMPFCLADPVATWGRARGTLVAVTYLGLAVPLVVRTQSREGAVLLALACLASVGRAGTASAAARGVRRAGKPFLGVLLSLGVLWLVVRGLEPSRLEPRDLSSLSGRTEAYGKAWGAFLRHPLLGDGNAGQFLQLDALAAGAGQSAHNAYLSVLGQGGLLAGCLAAWVVASARVRPGSGPLRGAVTASLLTIAAAALVGDLHLLEATWAVYALARLLGRGPEPDAARPSRVALRSASLAGARR